MTHSYWRPDGRCPRLFLAPMEGLGDTSFRKAFTKVFGGYDEATTPFMRVPSNAHVKSLAKKYDAHQLGDIPCAAQIMGGDAVLMASMAAELEGRGAPRIDINVGCPSNTVVGRNAGSVILKDPTKLYNIANAVVNAVEIPVSIKMRAGFNDDVLFKENLHAAEDSGASFIIVHPRTKKEGYSLPSHWERLVIAKASVSIPVVGNGDIIYNSDAVAMVEASWCDGIMVGRGALMNPWIFHDIRRAFSSTPYHKDHDDVILFLHEVLRLFPGNMSRRIRINKLKGIVVFLFHDDADSKESLLKMQPDNDAVFLEEITLAWRKKQKKYHE